jgi:hypothetical protein
MNIRLQVLATKQQKCSINIYLITGIFFFKAGKFDEAKKRDLFPKNYAKPQKLSIVKYCPYKITKFSLPVVR